MGLFNRIAHKENATPSVRSIVCPNCGATATNMENCEYCGSFLVRFAEQNLPFDQERYSEDFIGDPSDYKIGEYLDFQLETARQPGINGVGTQFAFGGRAGEYTDDTFGFVMNGKYLSNFHINIVDPSSTFKTKKYDIPVNEVSNADFVVAALFVGYSAEAAVNSIRSQESRNIIMYSQTQKNRFLKRCEFSKLMNHKTIENLDYVFDVYYMNLGQDVKGAASIILQLAHNNNDGFSCYEILDPGLSAFVDTF